MTNNPHFQRAFTMFEMIIVLGVLAIMMSFVVPSYQAMSQRAKATKDMNNLRQIALATQMYMNDNSDVFPGSATLTWMSQFETNQKYLSAWRVLQSPFDSRASSEAGTGTPVSKISYGINSNVYSAGVPISAGQITKPTAFITFAPAQDNSNTVKFQGVATTAAPGVTVNTGGSPATGGTHNNRTKINALFADWHVETMSWSGTGPAFTHTSDPGGDPDAPYRWSPHGP